MYRVIVTGGSGLLGTALVSKLSSRFNIYSIDKKKIGDNTLYKNIIYLNLDLTSEDSISIIESLKPDIIIHCAAIIPGNVDISEESIREMNTIIDKNIISISAKLNCYLIYMSSTIVYGYSNNIFNIKEDNPLKKISPYAEQKLETEVLITNNINRFLILRINAPYGHPLPNKTVLTFFCEQATQDKTLYYHGSGRRMQDFTNVKDIADLIYFKLKSRSFINGIYNISAGKPISMINLAELIVSISGSDSKIEASGITDEQENYKASYSIEKAKNALSWEPKITLKAGIKELIKIMKKC